MTVIPFEERCGPRLSARSAASIEPIAPEWIWRGWVLRRALNLLVARQGSGKTTLASHLAAAVTRGRALPGGDPHDPWRVGFLSLEEPADRVVARLHAESADLDKVTIFGEVDDEDDEGRPFRRRWALPKDVGVLGQAVVEHELALVVVDGLGYSISGDSHNYAVVGSALAALAGEAERTGCAILGLVHPPKGASDPVTAAIGSTAWTAIPRVCLVLGLDPNDETGETRVVSVGKSNYQLPAGALAFTIGSDPRWECGAVVGLHPTLVNAEDVMAGPVAPEERTARTEARDFLADLLADGPMETKAVIEAAERVGISKRTVERARVDLHVVSRPRKDPETGRTAGWMLQLPTPPTHTATSQPWRSGRSGRSGHIQEVNNVPLSHTAHNANSAITGEVA